MADQLITLLDITKKNGTDLAVGIVEEVRTFAPEVNVIGGRPIKGTSYKSRVRTALPSGPAFRRANEGADLVASKWDTRLNECFMLDAPMQVDELVAAASEFGVDSVLADEAIGVFRQKAIALGAQFYYGTTNDAKGFPGLQALYDLTNMEVTANAKGSLGATTSSAWLVVNAIDCVEFIYGMNQGLNVRQWMRQQVQDANSKKFFAWVNNLSGWIGLAFNYTRSVCRIKNLTAWQTASSLSLNDNLVAQALAKFPVGVIPTHLFCNRAQRYALQASRAPIITAGTGSAITSNQALQWAPTPVESNGIQLYVTDSLTSIEAASTAGSLT